MQWSNIFLGFETAVQPVNLLFCFIGVLLGQLVGILPGLGPAAAIAILLPVSFTMPPATAIILLAGIYYGAQYGGTITSVLLNVPGESSSVVTTLDGYQMAQQGRGGAALGIAAIGSFIAGTVANLALMVIGPLLADIALDFGPAEYFSLMILGMATITIFTSGSVVKGWSMAAIGVLLGSVGKDIISGVPRFTFGVRELMDGIGFVPVVMGLFGVAEVLSSLEEESKPVPIKTNVRDALPSAEDMRRSAWPIARGTVLGFFLGLLPGAGSVVAAFASYAVEKRLSPTPEKFGTGMIEGVAGPESANNAAAGAGFVPLLSLGIPATAVMALLLGALMIHGIQPGPMLFSLHPEIVWGVIASMYIGNLMLLILNLPLIPLWVKCVEVPYAYMFPLILLFCLIGAFSLQYSLFDVGTLIAFGLIGYLMKKFDYEPAPLILALILTPLLENGLRQSLMISQGSPMIFITRPLSAAFLVLAALILLLPVLPARRRLFGERSK
jgi:putative tricarboxylic transport membrane protein